MADDKSTDKSDDEQTPAILVSQEENSNESQSETPLHDGETGRTDTKPQSSSGNEPDNSKPSDSISDDKTEESTDHVSVEPPLTISSTSDHVNISKSDQNNISVQSAIADDKHPVEDQVPSKKQDQSTNSDDLEKLHSLCRQLCNGEVDGTSGDSILPLILTEDMSSIKNFKVLQNLFIDYLHALPAKIVSGILSILTATVKKSVFHLESSRGLLIPSLNNLISNSHKSQSDDKKDSNKDDQSFSSISLTKHFLCEWINILIAHSCDVEELKCLLKLSEEDPKLLNFVQQANLKQRKRPSAFFAFPGTRGSMMSMPPFQKWPIQFGWSFSTWLYLEPKACAQPFLYNFKTGKSGLGYSAHFTGNCLVLTSIRVKGKGVQHCIAYEFPSHRWTHCAITYHNKWRSPEVRVYVNGQLLPTIEIAWQVQTNEIFDKCFIGGNEAISSSSRTGELNNFCGQMSAIYLFNEGLGPAQICAIHRLGPSYMGQFKYSNESQVNLPPKICKTLYEEKLASSIFCLFSPVAVDSGTLSIQLAPLRSSTSKPAQNYFLSAPHAALLGQTKAIVTQQICSTIQSIGCSRSLLPLLHNFVTNGQSEACTSVIGFLCDLLESSPHWFANEVIQNNCFVMIACSMAKNPRLLSENLLDIFLNLTRTLLTATNAIGDLMLLKHLMDNILFNPNLWVYAEPKLQLKLYNYLANEFLHGAKHSTTSNGQLTGSTQPNNTATNSTSGFVAYNPLTSAASSAAMASQGSSSGVGEYPSAYIVTDMLFGEVRRVSTILQCLHALKYYYWVVEEKEINHKAQDQTQRPSKQELIDIRTQILQFTRELIIRSNSIPLDETQGVLNYLATCTQPENVLDVINMLALILQSHPETMVLGLDQKQGIKVIFNLISSPSEEIRLRAIQLLTLLLSKCTHKRKQDIMGPHNLYMLLYDQLREHLPMTTHMYEALLGLMIESVSGSVLSSETGSQPESTKHDLRKRRIENSLVIKVIASLLRDEYNELNVHHNGTRLANGTDIRAQFINDLWNLIINSRENRRIILQMSVWQHWLINLIGSTVTDSALVKDQILAIFRVLLYHATRYEYGGWRVWIDTLAIIHTKVSLDEFLHSQLHSFQDSLASCTMEKTNEVASLDDSACGAAEQVDTASSECPKRDSHQLNTSTASESNDHDTQAPTSLMGSSRTPIVSSISDRVLREENGIDINTKTIEQQLDDIDPSKTIEATELSEVDLSSSENQPSTGPAENQTEPPQNSSPRQQTPSDSKSVDSVDVAPTRSFRKNRHLDEPTSDLKTSQFATSENSNQEDVYIMNKSSHRPPDDVPMNKASRGPAYQKENSSSKLSQSSRATATPAFRIPEFRWNNLLIKLLNDLMFSIECDLYNWRCSGNCMSLDMQPFVARSVNSTNTSSSNSNSKSISSTAATSYLDQILQRNENQVYLVNIIHFVSQLSDNIIVAAGGLLPLLADATGGGRSSSSNQSTPDISKYNEAYEGLLVKQANSLLYRLTNIIDVAVFAASHINLADLEADKSAVNGGILRQCLRLACTVTVKNCLIIRAMDFKIADQNAETVVNSEFPRDFFDTYHGCSLLSANNLFTNSKVIEHNEFVANLDYSPHQTPNSGTSPSLLPFQQNPIKDPNKLVQSIDANRIQASIYHTLNLDSRESQFLALASLYFISVLMVSKYRDIIEPKAQDKRDKGTDAVDSQNSGSNSAEIKSSEASTSAGAGISNIESNLLSFGRMQPTTNNSSSNSSSLTDLLTSRLETTLEVVCPLLKAIMCDFCAFLSKTLIGSHGQDLVNKEADRAFRCVNTSPVELVMLLCSQEWQNTLQKNAGLAFIELINEGRMSSIGMKEHIVRVAMEAEFILSRLRADDVAKHDLFNLATSESLSARLHEENLINSLVSSATRRDFALYRKFQDATRGRNPRRYKLDVWEDDDRRRRRFVLDSCSDELQLFYAIRSEGHGNSAFKPINDKTENTKRILKLQETIEMIGIDDHCSAGLNTSNNYHKDNDVKMLNDDKDFEIGEDEFDYDEDDEEGGQNGSISPDSDPDKADNRAKIDRNTHQESKSFNKLASPRTTENNVGRIHVSRSDSTDTSRQQKATHDQHMAWAVDECNNANEFTGNVLFAAGGSLIWSVYSIPGMIQITNEEVHFEPSQNINEVIDSFKREPTKGHPGLQLDDSIQMKHAQDVKAKLLNQLNMRGDQTPLRSADLRVLCYCDFLTCNGRINLSDIRAIFSRHYLLQPHAIEIFLAQRTSIMFAFADSDTVKRVVRHLPPVGVGIKYGIPQSRRASLMSARQLFAASNMTQKWQRREIGNFQYLMFLNTIAGRTYQDLNQYHVFPWIITNYESEELDLNLPSNFRDLSKPVGALNSERRNEFIERYQSWDNPRVPAFHYGTHYSTAAFTLNWLCRLRGSYNCAYLALHDGKYEDDPRLFMSIGDSWVSSLAGGQQNVKELIPEFFYLPEMFHTSLGLPQVELPPWAKTPEQFIRLHRLALESELVSCQLHQWIDLIFGYRQRGTEAINAVNTFYYLTYQGNVNLNMIQDASLREAIATQIKHFGQTPSQLTTEPHPPRFSALHVSPLMFSPTTDDLNKVVEFPFNTSVVYIAPSIDTAIKASPHLLSSETQGTSTGTIPNTNTLNCASSILTVTSNNQYQIHNWNSADQSGHPFVLDTQFDQASSARRQLIDVDDLSFSGSLKLLSYMSSSQLDQNYKQDIEWPKAHHVATLDGRFLIMGSFYDNSFRVFSTSNGKLCQVIFGHRASITCMTRSEGNANADFYLATGSQDCSLLLWSWNDRFAQIEGSGVSAVHNPLPKLSISGHQTPVLSAIICAELGLIISGSKNLILAHTTTSGENLLEIDVNPPQLFDQAINLPPTDRKSGHECIPRPHVKNKERTLLEASMLGHKKVPGVREQNLASATIHGNPHGDGRVCERYPHLKELSKGDYYITNLQLAREPAFIVCVALPPSRNRKLTNGAIDADSASSQQTPAPCALLVTFNLAGNLMGCTTIGQSINGPRLGDVCTLQATRDGEHLILNDSPTSVKIYRTFDLQPINAYNTNDIHSVPSEEQNRVKSLCLVDHRFILVGLDNGKIVIYNAYMKNVQ